MNRKRKSTISSGSVSKNVKQNDREYIVERILDRRVRNGKIEYLLKWQGYSNAFNSWEPESNCNFAGLDDFNTRFDEEERIKNEEYGFNSNRDSDETSLSGLSNGTNNNSNNFKPKNKHKSHKKSLNSPSSSSNHNKSLLDSSSTSISTNLNNKSKSSTRSLNGDQSSESSHDSSFILNDDNSTGNKKSGKTINRLEMNYPVEHIYGATETTNGELMYLVKWKNLNGAELVNGQALEKRQPQVVLQFFRSNFKFK